MFEGATSEEAYTHGLANTYHERPCIVTELVSLELVQPTRKRVMSFLFSMKYLSRSFSER
jgi:hypothetical protein